MSTRGFVSFVADGQTKTAYNHYDSYPSGLGADVLSWLQSADLEGAKEKAQALRLVDDEAEPTEADIERLKPYYNPSVGERSERPTWYQLLHETQGNPGAMLAAGAIEDASRFPADSLFAEWGYVVDFDAKVFEVYVGFQSRSHGEGRFAAMPRVREGYAPVRLIKSWPLAELPPSLGDLEGDDED